MNQTEPRVRLEDISIQYAALHKHSTGLPLDRRDFNITLIEITFEADEINTILDVSVPIAIFDDEINEVEEEIFVVVLELVDAINSNTVDFNDATLCRIIDDDRKYLMLTYMYVQVDVITPSVMYKLCIIPFFFSRSHFHWV